MVNDTKEIMCGCCSHLQVCSFKNQFLKVQEAVDNLTVGDEDCGIKYLRDFDWIKPVSLECVHFTEKRTNMRAASEAMCTARGV